MRCSYCVHKHIAYYYFQALVLARSGAGAHSSSRNWFKIVRDEKFTGVDQFG